MCPVCGTTLELASDSPQAIREREFIRGLIAEGRTKEEIKDALVAEFGEEVLATPTTRASTWWRGSCPDLAIVVGRRGDLRGAEAVAQGRRPGRR